MGGKTNFYISDNTYLHHANYNFALESGAMVSAFLGKILIGLPDYDDKGQLRFNPKRTIIISASNFVKFIKVVYFLCKEYVIILKFVNFLEFKYC